MLSDVLSDLVPGLFGLLGATGYQRYELLRRRTDALGGREQASLFGKALRRGRVPRQANLAAWSGYVESRSPPTRTERRRRWMGLGVAVVVCCVLAVLFARTPDGSDDAVAFAVLPLLIVAALPVAHGARRRNRRRLARLRDLLRQKLE